MNQLTIALFQQDIVWEQPQANFAKVEQAFASALQDRKADILVVPETFTTGFSDSMAAMAESPLGPTFDFALSMARRFDALFVGTWTVLEGGCVFNRLHWVQPDGRWGFYDKGHTFRMSSEASQLARGTRTLTFDFRGWRIRPAVCYDLRFPLWLRNRPVVYGEPQGLDYDLLLVCANWPGSRHEAWSTLLKARAIENQAYVVGTNRVGIDGVDIPYSGHSAIIDFKGLSLADCEPGAEQVVCATLSLDALTTFRQHWPFYLDADPFLL